MNEKTMKATGIYSAKKWIEETYSQISTEMKLTKASVEFGFSGEIEGSGFVEYLMFYRHFDTNDPHNSSASYVGLIRFEGKLGERSGSFVMEDCGTFQNGAANSRVEILAGSGREELSGISGAGSYRADGGGCSFHLEHNIQSV
jgi:hypothetical protein